MKLHVGIFITVLIALLAPGCRDDDEEQRLTWSTDAPLTIPYRVRLQRYERENLIRNHSFETGKIFKLDTATTSFSIDGWQVVGRNVLWTDTRNDSIYEAEDAFSGYRAVMISRNNVNETDDKGEGILSDFIKVIPGNYSLSLYARLENVKPLRARLGTRMYDAVDISIRYYDRNKIIMNPAYNYPMTGQVINSSFKGLSFANFRTIASFGWAKITGKSHHFPFPEGDFPSDAHFVRIFIGLRGNGTLWVDSVNLNYTGRNFSVSERMNRYTDTSYHTPEVFVPTPKEVTRLGSVVFYKSGMAMEELPVIVVPADDSNALLAAKVIRDAFLSAVKGYGSEIPENIISIVSDGSNLEKPCIVFSVGRTAYYDQYEKKLPLEIKVHSDGYFVYSPPDNPGLVLLGANNGTGLYYAALTVSQMVDSKSPVFHNNLIVDYPDFPRRYFTMSLPEVDNAGFSEKLKIYKLNGALNLNAQNSTIPVSDNFNTITIAGYVPPEDSTLSYNYPVPGENILPDNDGDLVIPQVFHNEMLDNSEYSGNCCKVTTNARHLYSGSSFFSLNTNAADIIRYSSVMGPNPVFLDNSMLINTEWGQYAGNNKFYPGKLRLYNIFEPFNNTAISEFFPLLDSSMFVTNLPVSSEISIIRLATAADFMWNSAAYSPDFALWKVLLTRYGAENARSLITYADNYAIILEALLRYEMKIQVARNIRIAQQTMIELTSILADISGSMGNQHNLVMEIQQLNAELRTRLSFIQPAERK